jgi:Zn-dependent peptidase ImmA (M78 family)
LARRPADSAIENEYLEPHVRGARAAHALRFELGLDSAPIGDLWDVINQRGVALAFHDFAANGGDGLYLWDGGRALIVVNSAKSKQRLRQRFTAAHELGHHELHRSRDHQLLVADRDVEAEDTDDWEREANAFAANLLAPDRSLRQDMDMVDRESEAIDPRDVVRLMRRYGLSYTALLNRLVHSGCLRARDRERLANEVGVVGSLARASGFDFDALFPPGPPLPEDYVLSVVELHQKGVITPTRSAELLRTTAAKASEIAAATTLAEGSDKDDTELDALLGL